MLLLWNVTHLLDIIKWPCRTRPKTVNKVLTQLCPFLDFEILVKVVHARYNHGHISVTNNDIDLKLHLWLQRCQEVKLDNSSMNLEQIMALVWFEHLVKVLHVRYYHAHFSLNTVYYRIEWQIVEHAVLWTVLVTCCNGLLFCWFHFR